MSIVKRYLSLCEDDIKYGISGLICGCAGSYYGVYANEHTYNVMQGDFSKERLKLLLYTNIISIIAMTLRGTLFSHSQKCMNDRLSKIIFKKIINQKTKFYETIPVNKLLQYLTNDVKIVSDLISLNINVISRSYIHVIATLWLLYNISFKLTILITILMPFNLIISHYHDKIHEHLMIGYKETNEIINTYTFETISHISLIKTYATEEESYRKYKKYCDKIMNYDFKQTLLYGTNLLIISNIPSFVTIAIILFAKYLNNMDGIITFILHNQSLYENIKAIIYYNNEFIKCKEPYRRISELLDTNVYNNGYYFPENDICGDITFNNITFKYSSSDKPILKNFNLKIKSGEKIAITGKSGCGKSTIVKLLIGILSPDNGDILIDNVDIINYDNILLKKRIGYVAQDSILFTDTIANNIAYGLENVSENDIIEAAKQANAHEFISKLPDKYETKIGGTELSSLSGGQKQRISIARALIRKPKIIIFDEATSALDPYCEELVQNAIKECCKIQNMTMIIIAHKKSAIDIVDKVYYLENSILE
jgi:ABC-type multidrug transport system fused ATPase/permease subunit